MQNNILTNISYGSLELIKWVALIFMTGDHINKYLFSGSLPILFEVGRFALPMFIVVLAHNLSSEDALSRGTYLRAKKHLLIFGVISSVPYVAMSGMDIKPFPLNILFTLLLITIIIECIDKGHTSLGAFAFICGGAFVEFQWPALMLGVSLWVYFRTKINSAGIFAILSCLMLYFTNGNIWAIGSVPITYLLIVAPTKIPRIRWAFYIYYPLHLSIFWLIRIPLKKAGYIFF